MAGISQEQLASLIEQDYRQGIIDLETYYRLRRLYGLPTQGERNCPVCGTANLPTAERCFRCREPLALADCLELWLRGLAGPHAGQCLRFQGRVVMGRDPQACNLVFADTAAAISRRHAEIIVDETGRKFVLKNHSGNGTFIMAAGQPQAIDTWTLRAGDRFCLSNPDYLYEFVQ